MGNVNWERWARAGGIGFIVLFVVGFAIYGAPPKVNASGTDIVSFFDGDRGRVLTGLMIIALAFTVLVFFIGAMANALREAGEGRMAAIVLALGAVFVAVQAVGGAIAGGLALNIASFADEGVVRSFNTMLSSTELISAYPLAGLIVVSSMGLKRIGVFNDARQWIGMLAGVAVLLHGTNWAASGVWSATGAYSWVALIGLMVWTLLASWGLYSKATAGAPTAYA